MSDSFVCHWGSKAASGCQYSCTAAVARRAVLRHRPRRVTLKSHGGAPLPLWMGRTVRYRDVIAALAWSALAACAGCGEARVADGVPRQAFAAYRAALEADDLEAL